MNIKKDFKTVGNNEQMKHKRKENTNNVYLPQISTSFIFSKVPLIIYETKHQIIYPSEDCIALEHCPSNYVIPLLAI